MKRLTGKTVLISGAALGMGASHARALVGEGANVVLGDIITEQGQDLAKELGSNARFIKLDVLSDEDWNAAVSLAINDFGACDVLVNNAGILEMASIFEATNEHWQRVLDVNLTGVFRGIKSVAPFMREAGGGSIINISSTAGLKGFNGDVAYGTSKWAVRGLTKHVAMDLAPHRIRVNSIHPGNVWTRMMGEGEFNFDHIPMKRGGQVGEISNLVIYLASDESSFSTGSEFVADGGELTGIANLFRKD